MRTASILFILLLSGIFAYAQNQGTYIQKIPGGSIAFRMVAIPAGKIVVGSTSPMADADESPVKEVSISPFWMSEHEITFEEWDAYFNDNTLPQSKEIDGVTRATPQYIDLTWGMGRDAQHPTNSMSHQAAMMYCKWLYSRTGYFFRLPTEAEWEYACYAGQKKEFTLDMVREMAWFKENSDGKFHHVKEKSPNAWGLYDMLGNLSEWTLDQYDPAAYSKISGSDPYVEPAGRYPRSARGGSYLDGGQLLRCSNRIASDPSWNKRDPQVPKSRWWLTDGMFMGFRVVRPSKQPSKEEIEKFYAKYLK